MRLNRMIAGECGGATSEAGSSGNDVKGASILDPICEGRPMDRALGGAGVDRLRCARDAEIGMVCAQQREILKPGDECAHLIDAAVCADVFAFDRDARASSRFAASRRASK